MEHCKTLLQTAFLQLLAEKPFEKITIKELIGQAQISRTSYYRHYYSQIDILHDILNHFFEEMDSIRETTHAAFSFTPENDYKFMTAIFNMLSCYQKNSDTLKIILSSNVSYILEQRLYDYIYPSFNTWLISTEQYSEEYISGSHYEAFKVFFTAGFVRILKDWINDDCQKPLEDILAFILKLSKLTASYIQETI